MSVKTDRDRILTDLRGYKGLGGYMSFFYINVYYFRMPTDLG